MKDILEPIIVDPPGLTPEQGWAECHAYVEKCGGLDAGDGEPNWRAAFGADPGIVSCPACQRYHWAWGRRVRCAVCAFEFPTDWWSMYSWGNHAAVAASRGALIHIRNHAGLRATHEARLSHPYYRYGFEHPVADAWKERDRIDWRAVMAAEGGQ